MPEANTDATEDQMPVEQWLEIRKEEGKKIDPATAEVIWDYVNVLDPYDAYPDLTEECIGRGYFARRPGSDIWVKFGDLPEETQRKLWEMHESELMFPAGLQFARRLWKP